MKTKRFSLKQFAETVKNYRTSKGWTQSQLAQFFGLSRPTIARIEAGQKVSDRVRGKMLQTICIKD